MTKVPKWVIFLFDSVVLALGIVGVVHGIKNVQNDLKAIIAMVVGVLFIGISIRWFILDFLVQPKKELK